MNALLGAWTILAAGGALSLLLRRRPALAALAGAGSAAAGCLLGLAGAARGIFGPSRSLELPWPVPAGRLALSLDPLASFFLLPLFLLALLCALYAVGYMKGEKDTRRLGAHWLWFNLLVAAIALVVTAANAVLFLLAWEAMTFASFFLVAWDHGEGGVRRAAWLYLLVAHLGVAFLFAFFLLAGTAAGSFDFASFGALGGLSPAAAALAFFLAVAGFGSKAGLFPLHVWLPDAHPAAPSHVSALMSGVLVKAGIYGILRVWTFFSAPPSWWGGVLMALGILGALFGIALAALQKDVKRCLAYSTVENVGIILLALGLGIFAAGQGQTATAALAFAGGLLHLWNHALFKGLLFLGAGSLLHGAGTRSLERMGGVLRRMPWTGTLVLGGCLAIAALPPLNGFAGEWLIYLGLLEAGRQGGTAGLYPLFLTPLLALTGGLAVIVFTRLPGIALLGEPRTEEAARAHESPGTMTAPMALLLLLCLGIGVRPDLPLRALVPAVSLLLPGAGSARILSPATPLGTVGLLGGVLLAFCLLAALFLARVLRRRKVAAAPTWGCGYASPTPRMAYTGTGYAETLQSQLLARWLRPDVSGGRPRGVFPAPAALRQESSDPVLARIFAPLFAAAGERCLRLRRLQQGRLHAYLLYVLLTLGALMAWTVWNDWGGAPWR